MNGTRMRFVHTLPYTIQSNTHHSSSFTTTTTTTAVAAVAAAVGNRMGMNMMNGEGLETIDEVMLLEGLRECSRPVYEDSLPHSEVGIVKE